MMEKPKENTGLKACAAVFSLLFLFFTAAVRMVDVKMIGEGPASVGFAEINEQVRVLIGTSKLFKTVSDMLLLVAIVSLILFFLAWLVQIFKYCSFKRVDGELYWIGTLYVVSLILYIVFEKLEINLGPVLKDSGKVESSYPSSHILCCITFFGAAMLFLRARIRSTVFRNLVTVGFVALIVLSVTARFLSGQHWLTDVIGSTLLGVALVFWYESICVNCKRRLKKQYARNPIPSPTFSGSYEIQSRATYERQAREWGQDFQKSAYTPREDYYAERKDVKR